jgi:hypothetical protein
MYQIDTILPKGHKIYQMTIEYANFINSKALKNLPKFGFSVWKHTIWQPWSAVTGYAPDNKNKHYVTSLRLARSPAAAKNKRISKLRRIKNLFF